MTNFQKQWSTLLLTCLASSTSFAADNTDVKNALKEEQELFAAQQARDKAEAEAIKAANDLAAAKAEANSNSAAIEAKTLGTETTLKKARVANDLATVGAMKEAFGAPPDVGNKGTVSFEDGKSAPTLLATQRGSLQLTWALASKLCTALSSEGKVYFVKPDFDSKSFAAQDRMNRFDAVYDDYQAIIDADPKLSEVHVALPAVMAATVSIQYLAGAIQTVANLFKNDTKVTISEGRDRSAWLVYFMAYKCPNTVPAVDVGAASSYYSAAQKFLNKVRDMDKFPNSVAKRKAALTKNIENTKRDIAALEQKKKPHEANTADLARDTASLKNMEDAEAVAARIKAILDDFRAKQEVWYEALVLNEAKQKVSGWKRATMDYVTQDGQMSKTNWLLGTRVYGASSGELIYRVTDSDGKVVLAGYLFGDSNGGKINLDGGERLDMVGSEANAVTTPAIAAK